ncbi:MAG: hypothetical protein AB2689_04310 [Candidatus Thiodiazotropha taylori]
MWIFKSIITHYRKRKLPMVGNVESICPYCDYALEKKPGRKKKCPGCNKFIYGRTSPKTSEKILITEAQIDTVEEQWSIVDGTHPEYIQKKKIIEDERKSLKKKFGREPSENDIKWSLLNNELIDNASNGNWGLYRNTKFAMAEILSGESKSKQALSILLEVTYLDVNGPCNTGGYTSKEFPPFQKSHAMIASGVINRASNIITDMELNINDTKAIFDEVAEVNFKNLKLPIRPETAWKKIKKGLFQ